VASTRGGSFCSPKCTVAGLFGVMQIQQALRGGSLTVAAVREDTQPWRGVPSATFPLRQAPRRGVLAKPLTGGPRWRRRAAADRPWPLRDPSAAQKIKSASRARTSRGTRFAHRSRIRVCFSQNEAMPAVFYSFAASRPGFLARNLPNNLARQGTAIPVCPRRRSGSFPWQFCLAGAMSRLKCRLHASFRFTAIPQQKCPKNAHEENRGNYQTFQTR
jgi:hypothetical protein